LPSLLVTVLASHSIPLAPSSGLDSTRLDFNSISFQFNSLHFTPLRLESPPRHIKKKKKKGGKQGEGKNDRIKKVYIKKNI
jgi:hypothetical protein